MNARTLLLLLGVALLLSGSALPGRAAERIPAPAAQAVDGVAVGGASAGGRYRIEPAAGMAAASSAVPASSEAGCCCVYLPCIRH